MRRASLLAMLAACATTITAIPFQPPHKPTEITKLLGLTHPQQPPSTIHPQFEKRALELRATMPGLPAHQKAINEASIPGNARLDPGRTAAFQVGNDHYNQYVSDSIRAKRAGRGSLEMLQGYFAEGGNEYAVYYRGNGKGKAEKAKMNGSPSSSASMRITSNPTSTTTDQTHNLVSMLVEYRNKKTAPIRMSQPPANVKVATSSANIKATSSAYIKTTTFKASVKTTTSSASVSSATSSASASSATLKATTFSTTIKAAASTIKAATSSTATRAASSPSKVSI